MRKKLIEQLKTHEGLRLFAYPDSLGVLTIGFGRNLQDTGISLDEAMLLLENDLKKSEKELQNFDWFNHLDLVRQEALIELHYNMGLTDLLTFKKMIAALQDKNYIQAAAELLDSLWAEQVGQHRSNDIAYRILKGKYVD